MRTANTRAEEKDLVIVGGGVAGYVAAIKAGQEGLKVRLHHLNHAKRYHVLKIDNRWHVWKSVAPSAALA